MQRWILLILVILALATGLLVGILNAQTASLDMLFFNIERSLGLIVTGAFISGLLLGTLVVWVIRVIPLRFRLKRLQREQQKSTGNTSVQSSETSSTTLKKF